MLLVERHIVKRTHKHWQEIDDLSFKSKNLFNAANYIYRQHFFQTNKKLSLTELYHLTKNLVEYRALPTKVSKQIIKRLACTWKGYFRAHKDWTKNAYKYLGEPKIPKYKHKEKGRNVVIYSHESVYKAALKQGICHLSMSGIKVPTQQKRVIEVRIVPQSTCYVIEIVYEQNGQSLSDSGFVAGIDLGLNNLVALTSNQLGFKPLLINGRLLKSVNQFYNKRRAKLQSLLPRNQKTSKRIQALTAKRNRQVDNYLHNVSRKVVDILVACNITTLVIGKNENWKQSIKIGKRNNQQFVQIPHAKLIEKITYKCQLRGIKVVLTEESYTSKCSFYDNEPIQKHNKYQGRRVERGLFKSASGRLINADINGAANIIRKVFPNAFANGIESVAVTPLLVNPV